jgi:HSP20 family protein
LALRNSWLAAGWPPIESSETAEDIQVQPELPGVAKDDLEVSHSANTLDILGEKSYRQEKKVWNRYVMESSYGSFQRKSRLPCEVEQDKIKAEYKNGLLIVTLPKTAASRDRLRKITVKTA